MELRNRVVSIDVDWLRLEIRDKDGGLAVALGSREAWILMGDLGRQRVWAYMSRKWVDA